jgi:hypothetical protein
LDQINDKYTPLKFNSNLPHWFFIEIPLNFKKVQNDVIKVMRWLQNLTMTKYCCKQFDIFLFVAKRFFMFFCLDASYIVVFLKTKFSSNYQCNLNLIFQDVEDIDLFIGGLAERPLSGAVVGPTFGCLLGQQFQILKKGDRFWYENNIPPSAYTKGEIFIRLLITTI